MTPINQNSGNTLLHYACLYGDIKIVRFILDTLNSKNEDSLQIYRNDEDNLQ